MSFKMYPIILSLLFMGTCIAQNKYEREYRIRKDQFPVVAKDLLHQYTKDAKRLKFYKETDSAKVSYEAKFKKDRLWYSIEFDTEGNLEDIEITIQPLDIPSETLANITSYFENNFIKHRIKKIQQQYVVEDTVALKETLRNAFQNLLLPSLNYEIIAACKENKAYLQYEILFDAEGNFKNKRKRLPPNYDHVLY